MRRRAFLGGLLSATVAPAEAFAQRSDLRSVAVSIQGRLSARTIARFVQLLRDNLGKTVHLDVTGEEAGEPGGTFDIGEGQGRNLTIEHRTARRMTAVRIADEYDKVGTNPDRFRITGHFDCLIDRTDGDPNLIRLMRTPNMALDRGARFPVVRL